MAEPDNRGDPFTDSDEAFFQAGLRPARELHSERPVTFDLDDRAPVDPVASQALDARRARFVRPVRSTLVALSVLATVGLLRHVWHAESTELAARTPVLVQASANAAPSTDLHADLAAAREAPSDAVEPLLATLSCEASLAPPPLADAPPAPSPEALFGPPAPPDLTPPVRASHRVAEHAKAKPLTRSPSQHSARPPRPLRRSAPITKAALLHALRSS